MKDPPRPLAATQRRSAFGVVIVAAAYAAATGLAQLEALVPAWRFDSPVQFNANFAVAVGFAWATFQLWVHAADRVERRRWCAALLVMTLLATIQASDWLVDTSVIRNDWLDVPLWLAATRLLYGIVRHPRERPWARSAWRLGLVFQTAFIVFDLGNGPLFKSIVAGPDAVASISEWTELLAIESYVMALVLRTVGPPAPTAASFGLAVGSRARWLFDAARLFRKASYPPVRAAFYPGVRAVLIVITSLWLALTVGRRLHGAKIASGWVQLRDLLVLGLRDGFDPLSYYYQDLYRATGRAEAGFYLTRHETKNGLLYALNRMRAQPYAASEMGDKLLFADCCIRAGIAVPAILLCGGAHGIEWRAPRPTLDRDLCVKPRHGRGARGVTIYQRIAPQRFRDAAGAEIDLEQLIRRLEERGRRMPWILQPRLFNHAAIADLASSSLIAVRVITCLNEAGEPVTTHGVLRILGRLEPTWPFDDELGAPIDLVTGALGELASDRLDRCAERWPHHPMTGRAVAGSVLADWPAVRQLAEAAHRLFDHRTLIGWDVALTPEGPLLLEGNNSLDVMFPQRVYRQGFGRGPLGPLLQHHLELLGRSRGLE
ncbi:sugar-transfer associated ATP-grasp domain-containing protein [Piscinibacter koreensis]|uniref:Alpha-L-glutamate ligase-related protein ATP-grasp domain-containing protein n=1 Tax=Piscinibacter koreensis TaxID=2742824 RepID=A0A7Y6TYS0_9BURK|nr:sugar-transfer associated ATP-grasp domain-containing protein [Schlegelella koreensis]NUZ08405.1 hypothetical protein [Schlegelella koreensis]